MASVVLQQSVPTAVGDLLAQIIVCWRLGASETASSTHYLQTSDEIVTRVLHSIRLEV